MACQIAFFSTKDYDVQSFDQYNTGAAEITYFTEGLTRSFFKKLMKEGCHKFDAVCVFVNDVVDAKLLDALKEHGIKAIFNRCAGFDRVDVVHAASIGIQCCRVPAYSPYAVAEMAVALLMSVNRKTHLSYARTSGGNFSIDGLTGFDLHGRTVGIIGTGKIGQCMIDIMLGFGCNIAAFDVYVNPTYAAMERVTYMTLDEVLACSDVISVHSPLLPSTKHMINKETIAKMKKGVVIINAARGGLIDTEAMLDGIASGHVRGAGIDVYEHEAGVFFNDCTNKPEILKDGTLARLMATNRVVMSAHQAFLTEEALEAIAKTTFLNAEEVMAGKKEKELTNYVAPEMAA